MASSAIPIFKKIQTEFAIKMNDDSVFDIDQYDVGDNIGHGTFHDVYKLKKKDEKTDEYKYVLRVTKPRTGSMAIIYHSYLLQILITEKILHDEKIDYKIPDQLKAGNFLPKTVAFGIINPGENQQYFSVMEAIQHTDKSDELFNIIYKKKKLLFSYPDDSEHFLKRINIIRQIVYAMEILRSIYIFHNDLKPENIMYNDDNNRITVIDFDMAKMDFRMIDDKRQQINFPYNTQEGTTLYFAPEKWHGAPYNYKVDVWALGHIMEELISSYLFIDYIKYKFLNPTEKEKEKEGEKSYFKHAYNFKGVYTYTDPPNYGNMTLQHKSDCDANMALTTIVIYEDHYNDYFKDYLKLYKINLDDDVYKSVLDMILATRKNNSERITYIGIIELINQINKKLVLKTGGTKKKKEEKKQEKKEEEKYKSEYQYFLTMKDKAFDSLREYIKKKYKREDFDGDIIAYYVCKLNDIYKAKQDHKILPFYRDLNEFNQIVNTSGDGGKTVTYQCHRNEDGSIPALELLYKLNKDPNMPLPPPPEQVEENNGQSEPLPPPPPPPPPPSPSPPVGGARKSSNRKSKNRKSKNSKSSNRKSKRISSKNLL
jgi:serine/threonine protein kinase